MEDNMERCAETHVHADVVTHVRPGQKDPLEKEMATHSSILA